MAQLSITTDDILNMKNGDLKTFDYFYNAINSIIEKKYKKYKFLKRDVYDVMVKDMIANFVQIIQIK